MIGVFSASSTPKRTTPIQASARAGPASVAASSRDLLAAHSLLEDGKHRRLEAERERRAADEDRRGSAGGFRVLRKPGIVAGMVIVPSTKRDSSW
jgi:hypothetical protein